MIELKNNPEMIEVMAREIIGRDMVLDEFSGLYRGPIKRIGVTVKDWAPTNRQELKPTPCLYFDLEWFAVDTQLGWKIEEEDPESGVRLIIIPIDSITLIRNQDRAYHLIFPEEGAINIFPPGSENNLIRENIISP